MALALCMIVATACASDAPVKPAEPDVPAIEAGMMAGRDGVSFGPGILLQGNLLRLGLYGFAGTSSLTSNSVRDGVKASLRDRTLGFGVQYRIARIGRRFTIGAFGQAAYYGSHIHATYFVPGQAVQLDYRASDRDPLVTVGPELDYQVMRRIRLAVRPGKNFGNDFAAQTAGGVSINVGVLVDTQRAGLTIARSFKKLFH